MFCQLCDLDALCEDCKIDMRKEILARIELDE